MLVLIIALLVAGVWYRLFHLFRLFMPKTVSYLTIQPDDLPSVSLCIPARNETHAMTACLESAVLCRYPKLEIIVLDDGSHDNTEHLIKSFARSGVRFVEGSKLSGGWLGKNHALQGLFKESSGSLILFADVDTRFDLDSIDRLVAYLINENADMVSALPTRLIKNRGSAWFATMRQFWNIIGHSKRSPAVSSSAWMIRRSVLQEMNGLRDVPLAVRPERAIAKILAAKHTFRFIISSKLFGITYEKKLSSQYETAKRIYYPDFGMLGSIARITLLAIAVAPYVTLAVGFIAQSIGLLINGIGSIVLLTVLNRWYLKSLSSSSGSRADSVLPIILVREILLIIWSFISYKLNKVTWKGRPVSAK